MTTRARYAISISLYDDEMKIATGVRFHGYSHKDIYLSGLRFLETEKLGEKLTNNVDNQKHEA